MAERTLGDVATRMLFENDRVRIWEMDLEPGQSSDVHEHALDYVLVQLEGDRIAGIFEPDTHGSYPPGTVEGEVAPGNAMFIERGGIETAKNTGSQRYREILIELKG
jgi:beta-alanine degradation protein BauB